MRNIILSIILIFSFTNLFAGSHWYGDNPHVGDLMIYNEDGILYGLKDSTGKIVINAQYNQIEHLCCGLFVVSKGNVLEDGVGGLIDSTGKMILPVKYNYMMAYSKDGEDFLIIKLIDTTGVISHYDFLSHEFINYYEPVYLKEKLSQDKIYYCLADKKGVELSEVLEKIISHNKRMVFA